MITTALIVLLMPALFSGLVGLLIFVARWLDKSEKVHRNGHFKDSEYSHRDADK